MSQAETKIISGYSLLLGIDITHSYYVNGLCPDFITSPDNATQSLLAGHRCVVKSKINGLDIYSQTDSQGNPFIAFGNQDTLGFELVLRNPDFFLFTDKSNLPNGNNADTHITFDNPNNPSSIRLDITRNFNQILNERVSIAFQAKPVQWIYYLLTSKDDSNSYLIEYANDPTQYNWKLANGNDDLFNELANQSPNLNVSRYLSGQMIPCNELGISNIQLKLKGSQTTLIDSLPNPYYRNFLQPDVDAAGNKVDAIYHIMTQLN